MQCTNAIALTNPGNTAYEQTTEDEKGGQLFLIFGVI